MSALTTRRGLTFAGFREYRLSYCPTGFSHKEIAYGAGICLQEASDQILSRARRLS